MYDLIVGLSGLSGCGKSISCKALQKEFDCDYFHMVGTLKELCKHLFDLTEDQVSGPGKDIIDERYGVTPREIILKLNDPCRDIDPDVWILACLKRIAMKENKARIAIVDGCRYINEFPKLQDWGGKVIRIKMTGQKMPNNHPSETAQVDTPDSMFDAVIEADKGDIKELSEQVVQQVRLWLEN